MEQDSCKDTRFKRIVDMVADETAARLNGGQVDGTPTRRSPSWGNILTLLAMVGSVLLVWSQISISAGELNQRVKVVEVRQSEDRAVMKEQITEIKADVKQVRQDIQKVLNAVERLNGKQDERERRGR